ncbi:MAG: ferrochelatase [Rickettsiales bacterium]|nr:ferrochelatase [Rickettsiales bacterium]
MKSNHPVIHKKTGVLLINLGTPENYDSKSVRVYLRQFLSDPRVIEVNPIIWKIILNLFILPFRASQSGAKYKEIWFKDTNESPLKYYTRRQAEKLSERITKKYENYEIDYAMRYGHPSIESKIHELLDKGCNKIIFIPLYPQYSATTSASISDEIFRVLKNIRWQPEFRLIGAYHDHKKYIDSLIKSLKNHLKDIDFTADAILSSYHGLPAEYFKKGDPYFCFCSKTNRLFNEALVKNKIKLENHFSFQSRFGPKKWLEPYTEDVLKELIAKKIKNLVVITPGFASDCIETLEEVNMEYKEMFLELGGENFSLIPCLNDSEESIDLIEQLFEENRWKA